MIRKAEKKDISRIAEILVFDKRMNYRSILKRRLFFSCASSTGCCKRVCAAGNPRSYFVYDDGIVKGLIHLEQTEIAEFYVDHFFRIRESARR